MQDSITVPRIGRTRASRAKPWKRKAGEERFQPSPPAFLRFLEELFDDVDDLGEIDAEFFQRFESRDGILCPAAAFVDGVA